MIFVSWDLLSHVKHENKSRCQSLPVYVTTCVMDLKNLILIRRVYCVRFGSL